MIIAVLTDPSDVNPRTARREKTIINSDPFATQGVELPVDINLNHPEAKEYHDTMYLIDAAKIRTIWRGIAQRLSRGVFHLKGVYRVSSIAQHLKHIIVTTQPNSLPQGSYGRHDG